MIQVAIERNRDLFALSKIYSAALYSTDLAAQNKRLHTNPINSFGTFFSTKNPGSEPAPGFLIF
ncbi:hypothetical protein G159_12345 [Planococcus glaciei CHR43]|nr:hypothetical protein G159_12345 [Planococcus glaciei CHR43]